MTWNNFQGTATGVFPYREEYRNIAKGAKQHDKFAISLIASELSRFVTANDVLIPAPNHGGRAEYTLNISKQIAKLTGAKVADCLMVAPHKPLYEDKDQEIYMSLMCQPQKENGRALFVDNVYDTGKTFSAAKRLIPHLCPLTYATTKASLLLIASQSFG